MFEELGYKKRTEERYRTNYIRKIKWRIIYELVEVWFVWVKVKNINL
jgi:FixJ family two-component response regulator